MYKNITIAVGITILFLGVAISPCLSADINEKHAEVINTHGKGQLIKFDVIEFKPDGTTNEWTAWYSSGEEITRNHTYTKFNSVAIRARAKDTHGAIGELSGMTVIISKDKQMTNLLILRFLNQFPFLEVFLRAMNLLR